MTEEINPTPPASMPENTRPDNFSGSLRRWYRQRQGREAIRRSEQRAINREFDIARARAKATDILSRGKRIAFSAWEDKANYSNQLYRQTVIRKQASTVYGVVGGTLLTLGAASKGYLTSVGVTPEAATYVTQQLGAEVVSVGHRAAVALDMIANSNPILIGASRMLENVALNIATALPNAENVGPAFLIAGSAAVVLGAIGRMGMGEHQRSLSQQDAQAAEIMAGIAH